MAGDIPSGDIMGEQHRAAVVEDVRKAKQLKIERCEAALSGQGAFYRFNERFALGQSNEESEVIEIVDYSESGEPPAEVTWTPTLTIYRSDIQIVDDAQVRLLRQEAIAEYAATYGDPAP
jgi:hypothetical protein